MDFQRLTRLVLRHKWLLLAITTVATAATWAGVRVKGKVYQASATLMPQPQALQTLTGPVALSSSLTDRDPSLTPDVQQLRIRSLIALMLSPRILGQLAAQLHLALTPTDLQKMLRVETVTPDVLRIQATAGTPELAQDLANGLASSFVAFYGDFSTSAVAEGTKLLGAQEAAARRETAQRQAAVQKYKASHRISSLSDQLGGALTRLNAIGQSREKTAAQLADQNARIQETESELAHIPAALETREPVADSPTTLELRSQIAVLQKDLALQLGVHTEAHPEVRALRAKLDSTTRRLHAAEAQLTPRVRRSPNPRYTELQQTLSQARAERDGLAAAMLSFGRSATSLEKQMQGYTGADLELAVLMQQLTAAEKRHAMLLDRLQQAEANADAIRRSNAIAIVSTSGPLDPPVDISKNKSVKLTLTASILSLLMTLFILAAWDYTDRRVRTSADAEALMELPVAGVVPRLLPRPATTPLPRLAALMPSSPETEAYRFLSLPLLFSRDENPMRVLMTATTKPGQGATTTLSNLAVTLAQGNRRVILVDANLRRPALHTVFELPNEVGLTTVLSEGLPVERALQATLLPNLALLSSGPLVENPWAVLRSTAMEGLVRRLRQMADFVLIDTPCAAACADAFNLAPLVDGVFMVLRSRHQPTGIEMKVKQMFEEAGTRVFGAVLNDVPIGSMESCRYYSQYYAHDLKAADGAAAKAPALPAGRG